MARWDDEDYWDDADFATPQPPPQRPIQQELEGSIYAIPDPLWGFTVPDRAWHPGVCVHCDLTAGLTFCSKGTDARRARLDRFPMVVVEPSPQNGLEKPTAFALDPRRIALNVLRKIHNADGWCGTLEAEPLGRLQLHLQRFLTRPGGATP